ncbi:hypothetical protein ABPG75_002644 [Micractinium tetrahymenae]
MHDASPADLEPFLAESLLSAPCLLTAWQLPDKRAALRFLQAKLATDDATHAAAALRRLVPHLPDPELEEGCRDLLATLGLRTAAWHRLMVILIERGTPESWELVQGEMRRTNLTPSMRVDLLRATSGLIERREVAAFWETCAELGESKVGAVLRLMVPPSFATCKQPAQAGCWWAGIVVKIAERAAMNGKELGGWAPQLLSCATFLGYSEASTDALDSLSGALFAWAGRQDAPGWQSAVWILCSLVPNVPEHVAKRLYKKRLRPLRDCLRRHLLPTLEAAAAEQASTAASSA